MFDMMRIGKRISELRKAKDMTQLELADRLSISFQAVSNWERGNSMPDISKLPEIAEIFGVTVDDILGRTNTVVEDVVSSETANVEEYSDTDIDEAAELLKPSQMAELLENTAYHPRVLIPFLPFLSSATVEEIADKHILNGKSIVPLLPFLSGKKTEELARSGKENGESIGGFLPFLSESTVKEFAFEAFAHGGIDAVTVYLPFMKEKDLLELMRLASQNNY